MAVIVAALMIDAGLSAPDGNLILTPLVFLASVWPGLAAQVKRWHDHDRTGKNQFGTPCIQTHQSRPRQKYRLVSQFYRST